MIARASLLVASGALWLVPARVLACPACVDPRAPNQEAFLTGTIMLSLLPLAMFFSLVLFVRRRVQMAATQESPKTR